MIYFTLFILEFLALFFLSKKLQSDLSSFFYRLIKNQKITIWLMAILFLPGTLVHEVSHLLVALFLFVPVGEVELIPEIQESSVKMGSVTIGKTDPIRRFFVGAAPFIGGIGGLFGLVSYFMIKNLPIQPFSSLLATYFVFQIGNTMFLSRKDLEGALELIALLFIGYLLFYFLGVRVPSVSVELFFPEKVVEILKNANIFLLAPIIIDVAIIFALRLFAFAKLALRKI